MTRPFNGHWVAVVENDDHVIAWLPVDDREEAQVVARFESARDARIARDVLNALDALPVKEATA